jgi:hypothetical protein
MPDIMDIPKPWASENDKLTWLTEAVSLGKRYLEMQPGWKDVDKATAVLSGAFEQRRVEGVSNAQINFVQRYFKELVAQMTNLNPKWGYIGENRKFKETEEVLNKCFKAWWPTVYGTLKVKEALQEAGRGKGYIIPSWNPNYYGPGRGEIDLEVVGVGDVYPIMPPRNGDLQKAFGVLIRKEMPLHEARANWPELRDKIVPTRGRATWLGEGGGTTMYSKYVSPVLKMVGIEKDRKEADNMFPTVDVYFLYLNDPAINTTGKTLSFGQPGTPWFYEVPTFGSQIKTGAKRPTGQIDPMTGEPQLEEVTRPANAEDCKLYPFRRLIIATDGIVIKDDTSPWWHGMAPVVPFDIYKWAWEYLSRPYPSTVTDIQQAHTELLRTVIDSANLRLDPPLVFDQRAHSMTQMTTFTPRKPGGRLQMDLTYGQTVKPLMDVNYYDVPQWILNVMEKLPEYMQKVSGINDMENLAKVNQIPSEDTISRILDLNGPVMEDQAREMERSLQRLGEMVKWLFFEFYNTSRRLQVLGPDGLTEEDFDYDPGLMIPDHMPGEDPNQPSQYSLAHRARWHAANFIFHIVPSSSYSITDSQRQLLNLQLFREGFPIDPGTVAETLGLPNWGAHILGDGPILEKFMKWKTMEAQFGAELQNQMMQIQAQGQMAMQGQMMQQNPAMALEALLGGANNQGRPPSGQEMPKLEQKNGPEGPRTTITES